MGPGLGLVMEWFPEMEESPWKGWAKGKIGSVWCSRD